ncbi:tetratricopeptide repeat protein [Spongiactinospora sp. TRM90649]|uniref:ATP-binding protein n=1 Tax=Spongiactinospora sp. TRM90649 TaxID=3031114 RepID=UPI0023F74CAC|nr:tetratricopeptide repeat protein [Spongiactinospora sp. TRM90649]MDF5758445.1 tetratricopeptide repeat protein [Spongiactinospora sp. TRM90649]
MLRVLAVLAGVEVALAGLVWFLLYPSGRDDPTLSNLDQLFGVLGVLAGVAALWVAVITLRRTPMPGGRAVDAGPPSSQVIPQTAAGDQAVSAALAHRAAPRALAGLPAAPGAFTGRDAALAEILAFLNPAAPAAPGGAEEEDKGGGTGVVVSAVTGMAGIGKTALALVAAHHGQTQGWFTGGVFFIDLRGYTPDEADRVPAEAAAAQLLRAMGVPDDELPPAGEEVLALYRSVLAGHAAAGRGVLVVTDNTATVGQVEPLLPAQPCHRLLVTSRHTLATLPAQPIDLTVLSEGEAVELLGAALAIAGPDGRVDADPDHAKMIARLCGFLPPALRIIASLLRAEPGRPLAAMAGELADARTRLEAMESGDRDRSGRPIGVRAAFDLSYEHLLAEEPEQARLFRLLPLSPGPDVSTAAAAVLAGTSELVVRRRLAGLVRAHLVTVTAAEDVGPADGPVDGAGAGPGLSGQERWGMHDLVRLYADEHGQEQAGSDDRESALDRLLDFYLRTADAADDHLRALPGQDVPDAFTGRGQAMAWFDAERVTLIAIVALAWATGRDHIAAYLPACLNEYLDWRRAFDDRLSVDAVAVQAMVRLGDRHGEGIALTGLGVALQEVRRFDEAITAHEQAAFIFQETGDRPGEGRALTGLGIALQGVRRFGEAITAYEQAAAIYRKAGDRPGEGIALTNLGLALQEVRRFEEAITAHEQDLAICREAGDRPGEGQALTGLGIALQEVRRFDEAITAYEQAAVIYRKAGDRPGEGRALSGLGIALRETGRFDEAITAHEQDLAICREAGDRPGEGQGLSGLGLALQEAGRLDEAVTAHEQAAFIFQEAGDRPGEGMALNNLGVALQEAGRLDEAITVYEQAAAIYQESGDRYHEGVALNNLGLALHKADRFDEAINAFERAVACFEEVGDAHCADIARAGLLEVPREQDGGKGGPPAP